VQQSEFAVDTSSSWWQTNPHPHPHPHPHTHTHTHTHPHPHIHTHTSTHPHPHPHARPRPPTIWSVRPTHSLIFYVHSVPLISVAGTAYQGAPAYKTTRQETPGKTRDGRSTVDAHTIIPFTACAQCDPVGPPENAQCPHSPFPNFSIEVSSIPPPTCKFQLQRLCFLPLYLPWEVGRLSSPKYCTITQGLSCFLLRLQEHRLMDYVVAGKIAPAVYPECAAIGQQQVRIACHLARDCSTTLVREVILTAVCLVSAAGATAGC
jgi:hypothetical protein